MARRQSGCHEIERGMQQILWSAALVYQIPNF
jgi:hypothetical protein